jgi:magnesium transporter
LASPQNQQEAPGAGVATAEEPGSVVDVHLMTLVIAAGADRDGPMLQSLLQDLHPTDLADVLKNLPEHTLELVIQLVGKRLNPAALLELPEDKRSQVLALLPADYIGRALGEMDTDDAAAMAADIAGDRLREVLAATPEVSRLAIEANLSFEEETAGRLMQREFVAAPEFWTVGQTIDHLRATPEDLPDLFFEIYIVDPAFKPIGATALSTILRAGRDTPLRDVMKVLEFRVRPEMDQEEVAFAFQRYHLASAPVVDEAGRLTGMVTVDDIVHVIREEGEEDLLKLSGVSEASQQDSVVQSVRARAPWLFVNLFTELSASAVIFFFQDTIDKVVALAVLMPIVASLGGNAGTQTLAVAVRSIAARDLTALNAARFVGREAATGAFNGVIIAVILSLAAGAWFHDARIAIAGGLAVIVNLTCAGFAGSLVPLGLKRFGADPAVASSVFVTWLTDTMGFLAFLGIATLLINH